MRDAVKIMVPGRSNRLIFFFQCILLYFSSKGVFTKMQVPSIMTAQIGRLMPKHHLHDTRSVNAPPTKGPATAEIPSIININPLKDALLSRGQEAARTRTEPVMIPAAPHPAMARPTMSELEFGAVAQTRDPILKNTSARMYMIFVENKV